MTISPTTRAEQELAIESERLFLASFGSRVRELRARRGMTRKSLAAEADVSERHLAQLEVGEGNVSIVLLRRVALALNVPMQEFFKFGSTVREQQEAVLEFLRTVPASQVDAVLARLRSEFSSAAQARQGRIALTSDRVGRGSRHWAGR